MRLKITGEGTTLLDMDLITLLLFRSVSGKAIAPKAGTKLTVTATCEDGRILSEEVTMPSLEDFDDE